MNVKRFAIATVLFSNTAAAGSVELSRVSKCGGVAVESSEVAGIPATLDDSALHFLQARVALAEYLSFNTITKVEVKNLFEKIISGDMVAYNNLAEMPAERQYVQQAIERSLFVERMTVERSAGYVDADLKAFTAQDIRDVTASKPKPWWIRLINAIRRKPLYAFHFAQRFASKITSFPEAERLSQFKRSLRALPALTTIEAAIILKAFPKSQQAAVYGLTKAKIIAPPSLWPLKHVLREIRGVETHVAQAMINDNGALTITAAELRNALLNDPELFEAITFHLALFKLDFNLVKEIPYILEGKKFDEDSVRRLLNLVSKNSERLRILEGLKEIYPRSKAKLDEIARSIDALPDESVAECIERAGAAVSGATTNRILVEYAEKYPSSLSTADVVNLIDAATSSQAENKIFDVYVSANSKTIDPDEFSEIIGSLSGNRDATVVGFVKENIHRISSGQRVTLADVVSSGTAANLILSMK